VNKPFENAVSWVKKTIGGEYYARTTGEQRDN
jgi:hypothetical protein